MAGVQMSISRLWDNEMKLGLTEYYDIKYTKLFRMNHETFICEYIE